MILYVANCIRTTCTRILTECVDASPIRGTITVPSTDSVDEDWLTSATATADVATRTDADQRSHGVIRKDSALSRFSARLNCSAGILTFLVDASGESGTVVIVTALRFGSRLTADVRISRQLVLTLANWMMIVNHAVGARGARIVPQARIHALRIDAGVIAGTVAVTVASDYATHVLSVTSETRLAAANCLVIADKAFCIRATRLGHKARVHALSIVARLVWHALRISLTFHREAGDIRETLISLLTGTYWLVILDVTNGVRSAAARVPTLTVDARLVVRTFIV